MNLSLVVVELVLNRPRSKLPDFSLKSHPFRSVFPLVARAIRNAIRANRFARIIRKWNPDFYSFQADSHESLEFPIRANHPIRANRANRFANHATKVFPLRWPPRCWKVPTEQTMGLGRLVSVLEGVVYGRGWFGFQTVFLRKSLMSVFFCPQFWGRKWLRQLYGRLSF